MIAGLKPYPKYKESAVNWFGKIPTQWKIMRLKNWIKINVNTLSEDTDPTFQFFYLDIGSVSTGSLLKKPVKCTFSKAPSRARRIVHPGDTIVSTVRPNLKAVWTILKTTEPIVASTGFSVLTPPSNTDSGFVGYVVQSEALVNQMVSEAVGIAYPAVTEMKMGNMVIVVPPFQEQKCITHFLEWATTQIGRVIRAKRKLIALLNEQKQAIIHRAVTRGIDPSLSLKPSGIPWLGNIPQHWKISRLARICDKIGDGLHGTPSYVEQSSFYFINGSNLVNGTIQIKTSKSCVSKSEFTKYFIPLNNSTLLISINGTIGNLAYFQGEPIILGKSVAYITCGSSLSRKFLSYYLQSSAVMNFLRGELTGTTISNLSLESIRNLSVSLPPLSEQLEIVSYIEGGISPLDFAIASLKLEMELLHEYRTRLTFDVVTGKIDVRDAAKQPPIKTSSSMWPQGESDLKELPSDALSKDKESLLFDDLDEQSEPTNGDVET